jgi:hypothetical protein
LLASPVGGRLELGLVTGLGLKVHDRIMRSSLSSATGSFVRSRAV